MSSNEESEHLIANILVGKSITGVRVFAVDLSEPSIRVFLAQIADEKVAGGRLTTSFYIDSLSSVTVTDKKYFLLSFAMI